MIRRSAACTTPLVKTTAALALAVSTALVVTPGPAHAASAPAAAAAAKAAKAQDCLAGSGIKSRYVDCSNSTASVLPDAVGKVLTAFGVDSANAIAGIKKLNGANAPTILFKSAGTAAVAGDGFSAAIGAAGNATATTENVVSAAGSLAVFGGKSSAKADAFGAAVAVSLGSFFGGGGGTATAHAMPFGVALANTTEKKVPASATALFGWASGVSNKDKEIDGASCVALYSQATGGGSSCTGVLLVLAKETSAAKDSPTIWAVRDLFSLTTKPVVGKGGTGFISSYGSYIGVTKNTAATLQTKIAPVFTRDFVRLEQYEDGSYLMRSDMPGLKPFFEWANPTPWTPAWEATDTDTDDEVAPNPAAGTTGTAAASSAVSAAATDPGAAEEAAPETV